MLIKLMSHMNKNKTIHHVWLTFSQRDIGTNVSLDQCNEIVHGWSKVDPR